jgi:tripartite-type tricarboxylate transporter receptor subunit TctC
VRVSHRSRWLTRAALSCAAVLALTACGTYSASEGAGGGDFPAQPVRFLVPYAPGGTTDPLARQFASALEEDLGAQVVVENVPGSAGAVGTERILTAAPDGYTFGMTTGSALFVAPRTTEGVSYQGPEDWSVLAKMSATPYLLVVRADAPWQTFDQLLQAARAGTVTVSTPGAFNPGDLVLEQLNIQTDDAFRAVPFSGGGGEGMTAVLGGQVNSGVSALATAKGQIEAGELRPLAVFADEPLAELPDVPLITDLGYDATLNADFFVIAPPGLPQDIADRLSQASHAVIDSPEFAEFVAGTGGVHTPLTAAEATADLQEQATTFDELFAFLEDRGRLTR